MNGVKCPRIAIALAASLWLAGDASGPDAGGYPDRQSAARPAGRPSSRVGGGVRPRAIPAPGAAGPGRLARAAEDQTLNEPDSEITVFYNGAGPRCVRDRERYERWAGPAGERVCGFDLTGQDKRLR